MTATKHTYNVVIVKLNGYMITEQVEGLHRDAMAKAEELINNPFYFWPSGYRPEGAHASEPTKVNPFKVIVAMADGSSKDTCYEYSIVWQEGRRVLA